MLINGSSINAVAINTLSQLIAYLAGNVSVSVTSNAANSLWQRLAGSSEFSSSTSSNVITSAALAASSNISVSSANNVLLHSYIASNSGYSVATQMVANLRQYMAGSSELVVGATNNVTTAMVVGGSSSFTVNSTASNVLKAYISALAEVSLGSSGSSRLQQTVSTAISELSVSSSAIVGSFLVTKGAAGFSIESTSSTTYLQAKLQASGNVVFDTIGNSKLTTHAISNEVWLSLDSSSRATVGMPFAGNAGLYVEASGSNKLNAVISGASSINVSTTLNKVYIIVTNLVGEAVVNTLSQANVTPAITVESKDNTIVVSSDGVVVTRVSLLGMSANTTINSDGMVTAITKLQSDSEIVVDAEAANVLSTNVSAIAEVVVETVISSYLSTKVKSDANIVIESSTFKVLPIKISPYILDDSGVFVYNVETINNEFVVDAISNIGFEV